MSICIRRAESFPISFFFLISSISAFCKRNLRNWCLYKLLIYLHFWTDVCFEDPETINITVKKPLRDFSKSITNKSSLVFTLSWSLWEERERKNNLMIGSSLPTLQPETMCLVIQHFSLALRHAKHLYAYTFNVNSIEVFSPSNERQ